MLHTQENTTCPILGEPGNYHFEMVCEDCDVQTLSRLTLGDVESRFEQGRVSRDELDAYRWVWALMSSSGSNRHWAHQPYITDPAVIRIARKLVRARNFDMPAGLAQA